MVVQNKKLIVCILIGEIGTRYRFSFNHHGDPSSCQTEKLV